MRKLYWGTTTSSFSLRNNWQSIWITSSEPEPQIIFDLSQPYFFDIFCVNSENLLSGYFDISNLDLTIFSTFLLTPKADSFADNLIIFLLPANKDFPGL